MKKVLGFFIFTQIMFGAQKDFNPTSPTNMVLVRYNENKAEQPAERLEIENYKPEVHQTSPLSSFISVLFSPFTKAFNFITEMCGQLTEGLAEIGDDPIDSDWDYFAWEKKQELVPILNNRVEEPYINTPLFSRHLTVFLSFNAKKIVFDFFYTQQHPKIAKFGQKTYRHIRIILDHVRFEWIMKNRKHGAKKLKKLAQTFNHHLAAIKIFYGNYDPSNALAIID